MFHIYVYFLHYGTTFVTCQVTNDTYSVVDFAVFSRYTNQG